VYVDDPGSPSRGTDPLLDVEYIDGEPSWIEFSDPGTGDVVTAVQAPPGMSATDLLARIGDRVTSGAGDTYRSTDVPISDACRRSAYV
jgi:hypothetical protein